ncbi:energy-coupling factor transporter ATPase [Lactobacillus jensenii]|uniref:energy-coupling factor transporter ATPase n=1 Tax=Lactobacillus jensenii TaxID=109790 RepID=UPI001F09067A|nr:energy-coupling factor transporter ATPase [Lactobacillus jensenii]
MSIKFEKVDYIYSPKTPFEKKALNNISFELKEHSFVAIIGHTGSGKSTLMQHFNALLKPSAGQIKIAGFTLNAQTSNKNLKRLREKVSLVFQFPEAQLFESTVLKDIEYGPKNFGYSEVEANELAKKWLKKVGLPSSVGDRSPFDLSGGQMRRVAIAGVMAYEPDILCLDEPAAGLDPQGKREMFALFKQYQKEGHTVILVTHNMDDVAEYADDILVLEKGKLLKHATPEDIFSDAQWLSEHHLAMPTANLFAEKLVENDLSIDVNPLTIDKLANEIEEKLVKENNE